MKRIMVLSAFLAIAGTSMAAHHENSSEKYFGNWALHLPGGAGWLNVWQANNYLDAEILWYGGSVVPVASVYMDDGDLVVTRLHNRNREWEGETVTRSQTLTQTITFTADGDTLHAVSEMPSNNGLQVNETEFHAKRLEMPSSPPDLSEVEFGDPIVLFNGENLDGWTLTNTNQVNGWRAEDGTLINDPVQTPGEDHISYGNLRTEQEFEDFNLTMDVKVWPNGNSGIYLRGIYEVQVADTHGRGLDSHYMGGVYSRIAPSVDASKPANEWQTYDITLVDRHITVKLNGTTIIDNEPVYGPTGGALWADVDRPGPIYLQGDHTGVTYKNIVLRPVIN